MRVGAKDHNTAHSARENTYGLPGLGDAQQGTGVGFRSVNGVLCEWPAILQNALLETKDMQRELA